MLSIVLVIFAYYAGIMLSAFALISYYAQKYGGMIGWSLVTCRLVTMEIHFWRKDDTWSLIAKFSLIVMCTKNCICHNLHFNTFRGKTPTPKIHP